MTYKNKIIEAILRGCWIVMGLPIALVWACMIMTLDINAAKSTITTWWNVAVGC